MSAVLLDGKALAARVREEVARRNEALRARIGRPAGLVVFRVGDDPASETYVRGKKKAATEVGIAAEEIHLPADTAQADLVTRITQVNAREDVDAVLVQLPLPPQIRPAAAIDAIKPTKDVDGLHPTSAGLLFSGRAGARPCTPLGCLRLLDETGVKLEGARAVVIGRSNLVGKPVAMLLQERNATVTMCHSKTKDLDKLVGEADIVIAAMGKARFVKGAWIKPGAVVLDVGTNRGADGKLCGDVEFDVAKERAGWITPVPGGVGPMTVAMLLWNAVELAERRTAAP